MTAPVAASRERARRAERAARERYLARVTTPRERQLVFRPHASRTPLPGTQAGEGASLLIRGRSVDQARAAEALLATPGAVSARRVSTIGDEGNLNGVIKVHRVKGPGGDEAMRVLVKPIRQGGAHEVFAYDVAKAMGIDHLLPVVQRAPDGGALMELVPGEPLSWLELHNANRLEQQLRMSYRSRFPAMPATEASRRARVDVQLMQTFDYVIANRDRRSANALFDLGTGRLTMIDHTLLGASAGTRSSARHLPMAEMEYVRGVGTEDVGDNVVRVRLTPEVRNILEQTDREAIRTSFARFLLDTDGVAQIGVGALPPTPCVLDDLMLRLDDVVRTGVLKFVRY